MPHEAPPSWWRFLVCRQTGYDRAVLINSDFHRIAVVILNEEAWIASPAPGVERIMLDRIGDEVARATSVVRYAPDSRFERHEHAMGEEFLVLEGTFSDEHADYPAGTYVRNPPGSSHAPFSEDGCRILVKLRQFEMDDLSPVVVDTTNQALWNTSRDGQGESLPLHRFGAEDVRMLRLQPGQSHVTGADGTEVFVVSGSLIFQGNMLAAESWLRIPRGDSCELAARGDAILWLKSGHLPRR